MFQPMMNCTRPGPIRVVVDSVAGAIARLCMKVAAPERDALGDFMTNVLPLLPSVLQVLKPSAPVDLDGPKVQQIKRELAAEEAHLTAVHAEKLARLVADFGPKFDAARAADETDDCPVDDMQ
jgi:hypothetical protein